MRTSTTALAAAALAASVTGCGGGDKTFDESGMTFTYPGDLKAGRAVGATPSGRVVGALRANLPAVVAGVIPATVHVERHGRLMMVAATEKPPGTTNVESQIYFFNGAGRTWQLECRSTPPRRTRIRAACRRALATMKVS